MFLDFLNMWAYKKIQFFTIFGLIIIGVGIIAVIILQSREPATSTRVYELPAKTTTTPDNQPPPTQHVYTEPATKKESENENDAGDNVVAEVIDYEEVETATNDTDSPAQIGLGHYDPPPPDPEQERIWRMEARVEELQTEIEALSPQVAEDIKLLPRLNELREELLRLQQGLGRLHIEGPDPFIGIEIENLMATSMTEKGLPVSVGPRLADLVEKIGDIEGAEKIRQFTRKAEEKGDSFFLPEHVEN